MHVASILTTPYVTPRVGLTFVQNVLCSLANSPQLQAFSWLHLKLQSRRNKYGEQSLTNRHTGRIARNEIGQNFWHSFKPTNYHCLEFSFIQIIMDSFFLGLLRKDKCSRINLRRTAETTTVCAKCVPFVALGLTTGNESIRF